MISSQGLRQLLDARRDRLVIDQAGDPSEFEGLPDDAPIPAIVVMSVTEAVKQVQGDMIIHYVNRDAIWAVEGFLLDRPVVSSLPDDVDSAAGLIEAVRRAGHEWHAVMI